MPDDQAKEKYQLLEKLGATVEKVKPASIVDKNQFVNLAKRRAEEFGKNKEKNKGNLDGDNERENSVNEATGFFADQFENLANYLARARRIRKIPATESSPAAVSVKKTFVSSG